MKEKNILKPLPLYVIKLGSLYVAYFSISNQTIEIDFSNNIESAIQYNINEIVLQKNLVRQCLGVDLESEAIENNE